MEKDPSSELRVYAVWLPMLGGDTRASWDSGLLTDPRVMHFWDERRRVGRWFATQVEGAESIVWDAYYLYGPEAVWDAIPSPLVGSGRTIYDRREALQADVFTLLVP